MAIEFLQRFKNPLDRSVPGQGELNPSGDRPAFLRCGSTASRIRLEKASSRSASHNAPLLSFLGIFVISLAACSNSKPQLGTISVTDPTGKVSGQLKSV